MALRIRLARAGAKKRPYYLIVVAEASSPRDGRFIEKIGSYNPMLPKENEERIKLLEERAKYWVSVGAQPTDRVKKFLGYKGLMAMPATPDNPIKSQPKKKAQERVKEQEEKLAAAKAAAVEAEAAAAAAEEAAKAAAAPAPAPAEDTPAEPAPAPTPEATPAEEAPASEAPKEEKAGDE